MATAPLPRLQRHRAAAPRRAQAMLERSAVSATRPRSMAKAARRGPAGRRRARGVAAARRRARANRRLHLRRHRGQRAGADVVIETAPSAAARPALMSATEHPSVLAGGRFPREAVEDRRSTATASSISAARASADTARRGRWSPSCSPTTRPASSSRSREAAAIAQRMVGSLPWTRFRRPGASARYLRARRRFPDLLGPQDRRPEGRRCHRRPRDDVDRRPLIHGGGQENGLRAGPRTSPALPAFGAAAEAALAQGPTRPRDAAARPARGRPAGARRRR